MARYRNLRSTLFIVASLGLAGCGSSDDDSSDGGESAAGGSLGRGGENSGQDDEPIACEDGRGFATEVISFEFGEGQDFGQDDFPESVLGGPEGGGCCSGSLAVTSLGDGGTLVLGFGERVIIDGPGADFIVFENAFAAGGPDGDVFVELGQVSVSEDGETWLDFSCKAAEAPPYGTCAGWRPVHANVSSDAADPFDPETAGGDAFDLSEVGLSEARYVRVTDVKGDDAVFDLDAVSVVNHRCEALN